MDISQKIEELSHEMKILKNEIRQVLLDIREHVLTYYQTPPTAENAGGEEGVEELAEKQTGSGKKEEQLAPATGSGTTVNIGTDFRGAPDVRMEAPAGPARGQRVEGPSSASFRDEPVDNGVGFRDEPFGSDMGFGGGRDDFSAGDFGGERQRGGRQDFSAGDFGGERQGGGRQDFSAGDFGGERQRGGRQDLSAGDFGGERQQKGRGGQGDDMLGMMQLLKGMGGGQGGGDEYANYGSRQSAPPPNGGMDLTTIAMLARWVSNGIRRVGRKRMQSIVEMYQMTGNLSPKAREVIVRLVRMSDSEDPKGAVPMTACIPVLMQLNTILGGRQQGGGGLDPALLSILLG